METRLKWVISILLGFLSVGIFIIGVILIKSNNGLGWVMLLASISITSGNYFFQKKLEDDEKSKNKTTEDNSSKKIDDEMRYIEAGTNIAYFVSDIKKGFLNKKIYDDFWILYNHLDSLDTRNQMLRILKNSILPEQELLYEFWKSAYLSYTTKNIVKTENLDMYINDKNSLFAKCIFMSNDEYMDFLKTNFADLDERLFTYEYLLDRVARHLKWDNVKEETGFNRSFYKTKMIGFENSLKRLEILFTENYKGGFPN